MAAGQSFTIKGSMSEYDDFLRGGDDYFGDFTKTLTAPTTGPGEETFSVQLVESNPASPPPGDITIGFKVKFEPVP